MKRWMATGMALALGAALAAGEEKNATLAGDTGAVGANARLQESVTRMEKGLQAWRAGDPAGAVEQYDEALDLLESVEADYPGWATHLVRSRILACESALDRIRDGVPAEAPAAPSTNAAPPLAFALSASSAETALRAFKAGVEERDAVIETLRREVLDLKRENLELKDRLGAVEGQATAGASEIVGVLKGRVREWLAEGAYSNAIPLLGEMKRIYPADTGVRHLLAVAHCRSGAFEEGLREVEPLARGRKVPPDVWVTLGVAQLGLGNLGKARQAFEEALERDPNHAEAHYNMAQVLLRLKRPDPDLARLHYLASVQQGTPRDTEFEQAINQALMAEQARRLR